jgi:Xaa-Pro aminopeptidase
MLTRREALAGGLGAALAGGTGAAAAGPAAASGRPGAADLGFLADGPLVNEDRARFFLRREGLDALVVSRTPNVFYLSNHWPQRDRMRGGSSSIAIFPADPARPVALVMNGFIYYYSHSPESRFFDRLVFPYTQPADVEGAEGDAAAPTRVMRIHDPELVSPRERHRRRMLELAAPPAPDAAGALANALRALGLETGVLGIDDPELAPLIGGRLPEVTLREGENTLRRIRLAKSETEIRLMRLAAQQNVEAALAAASRLREHGSTRELRADFFAEAARRGNLGVFMVIDGSSSEVIDEPLREGMSLSIDCVSTCRFYHGDFGRTVFIGEPPEQMKRVTTAIARAWGDVREQLRAGMRFADIPRIGRESLRRQGMDISVGFTPHSVGLFHTDHPQPSMLAPAVPEELVLEENMVLSVDCPMFEAGYGGTAHLEDLMLIRRDGAEPLHELPDPVIVV